MEAYGRHGKNESKRFLNITLGSLAEIEYLLDFSLKLKYLTNDSYAIYKIYVKRQVICFGNFKKVFN
ncbi:MAG: four helix bundle protein [Candidatus Omnitrophica bacterium]|nr:four helix bundle protein [Candidatus Omnitrophota bacterium]